MGAKKLIAEGNYLRLHSMRAKKTDALDKRMTGARKRKKTMGGGEREKNRNSK